MRAASHRAAGPSAAPAHSAAAPHARRAPRAARAADKMCRDAVSTPKTESTATGTAVVTFLGAGGKAVEVECAKVGHGEGIGGARGVRRREGGGGTEAGTRRARWRGRAGAQACAPAQAATPVSNPRLPRQPRPSPSQSAYILDAGLAAGLELPYTCRAGICGACVGRVAAGAVDQSDVRRGERGSGFPRLGLGNPNPNPKPQP
jgi:hypothetical protein